MKNKWFMDPLVHAAAATLVSDHMNVTKNESVLITCDVRSDQTAVAAIQNAVSVAGGKPVVAILPTLPLQGKLADPHLPDPVRAAMVESDCWIDLTFPYIAGSDAHDAAIKHGRTRCLVAGGMDAQALTRIYSSLPLDDLYELQTAFDDLIAEAEGKECHLTDARGTNVRFVLAKPTGSKPRRADQAGTTYSLPGSAVMYPELESVKGKIVIESAMHDYYGRLSRPLIFDIDGHILGVQQDGADVDVVDRALRRAGQGEYGHVIHFSYGLHPGTRFRGNCFVEDIRTVGANAVGFGTPWWEPGGGENHPDGVLFRQSLSIDGKQILQEGKMIAPTSLASIANKLTKIVKPV